MRKILIASLLVLSACSTSTPAQKQQAKVDRANRPQIDIMQTSAVAIAARYVEGGVSVQYAVRIGNPAAHEIRLRRLTIQSVGDGAYTVEAYSVPFNVAVDAANKAQVRFWVPAYTGTSLVGANGPVTVRVVGEFDSTRGRIQEVVTRVVNTRASVNGQ
ncbi:MAG TPA: hypothetical protein VE010_01300 [Thermoanaerobaculia bacterium]|nr:hypothetical protein [Thermoanaerobaculia bacterium]